MMEFMLFPEMAMVETLGIGTLCLSICSALSHIRFKWLISLFFLVAALGSYQSYIGIYITIVCVGIYFHEKDAIALYKKSIFLVLDTT